MPSQFSLPRMYQFLRKKDRKEKKKKQNKTKQNKNKKIRALMKSTYKDLLTVRS